MKILGIGNAIVDVICKVDDNFISQNSLIKSTMKLIFDESEFKKLLTNLKIEKTVSGGSVANSIVGISQLGNKVGFIGKISDDDLGSKYEEDGYPDGITVDEEGNIWIAHWGSGIITKQSPNGNIVNKFNLPSINLTSLCFGGNNFKDLLVTSATDGMTEKDWQNFPESGMTFLIKTKEKGIKENSYIT